MDKEILIENYFFPRFFYYSDLHIVAHTITILLDK